MHVVIAHYAEPVPLDDGFVSTRYAELARVLEARGIRTTRLFPSFQHGRQEQRDGAAVFSLEPYGAFHRIETRSYHQPRSFDRLRFLRDYTLGVRKALLNLRPEISVIAVPPPGLIRSVKATPDAPKVIADLRDLWPEAQIATLPRSVQCVLKHSDAVSIRARKRDIRHADRVMSLSETFLRSAVDSRSAVPSAVYPLGCPPSVASRPLVSGRRGAIFVGSLNSHFDLSTLLEAWRCLERHHPSTYLKHPLTVVGDGPLRGWLENESAELKNVRILGWRPHAEAMQLMEESAVGVAPYSVGAVISLPNKLFEYLAAGLPIVSSLPGEMSALLQQLRAGYWAPAGDPREWAEVLSKALASDQQVERLGERAKSVARGRLSRTVIAERMADFVVGAYANL